MRAVLIESLPKNWTGWSGLKLFQNEEWVARQLIERNRLPERHHRNARKQAAQINFAISQAQEYWSAAKSSTQATAPLQLYYCCMSLALAQILWKKGGDHSIEKLRANSGHHGLDFAWSERTLDLSDLAKLNARPHLRNKTRHGTFEIWHQSASESSVAGLTHDNVQNVQKAELIFYSDGLRMPLMPEAGISLELLYSSLPRMTSSLSNVGIKTRVVRATLARTIMPPQFDHFLETVEYAIDVHPAHQETLKDFFDVLAINPNYSEDTTINELPSGFTIRQITHRTRYGKTGGIRLPDGICMSVGTTYFKPHLPSLNEFGLLYVTTYMLGMLCRYYPDLWMKEIKSQSSFMYLAEAFVDIAIDRIPLVSLSMMDGCSYVSNDVGMKI